MTFELKSTPASKSLSLEDPQFPFKYLQSAGAGAKSLIVPAVGDNFQWSAKQVAQMGGSRVVYIWAQKALMVKESESEQEVVRMNGFATTSNLYLFICLLSPE